VNWYVIGTVVVMVVLPIYVVIKSFLYVKGYSDDG
jgi:hypothetical protein